MSTISFIVVNIAIFLIYAIFIHPIVGYYFGTPQVTKDPEDVSKEKLSSADEI